MENLSIMVLTRLITDAEFRAEMTKDVDHAIEKAGLKVAPEFADKLKNFSLNGGFNKVTSFSVNDINEVFASEFGLESKW